MTCLRTKALAFALALSLSPFAGPASLAQQTSALNASAPSSKPLASVETVARQAILIDTGTGTVIFEKNADEMMPPSSMSKLMTAFMVFERLAAGQLRLEDQMGVSERAWRMQGSKMFIHVNDRVAVQDLLRGVIIQSGNDACVALAEGLAGTEERFAEQMTSRARELGLKQSVFRNASGWPDPQHLMTARELAMLAGEIIKRFPQYYHFYSEKEFTYGIDDVKKKPITQGNRNPLLYKSGSGADGLKTGHTEAAGYGLTASAIRDGRRLILVVNGLKSMSERAQESERLLDIGFREFETYKLFSAGTKIDDAAVWLGEAQSVPLLLQQDVALTLARRDRQQLKTSVVFEGPIPAPIRAGTPLARLMVSAPGIDNLEIPLVAGADVEKLGLGGRISAALSHILWGKSGK